jgi:hypothetical protein
MPFFNHYGKLVTGLQKIELQSSPLDSTVNHGLVPLNYRNETTEESENDPVWKASYVLDQLDRFEERARTAPATVNAFGQAPSVPWLDAIQKERAKQVIADAAFEENVSALADSSVMPLLRTRVS